MFLISKVGVRCKIIEICFSRNNNIEFFVDVIGIDNLMTYIYLKDINKYKL